MMERASTEYRFVGRLFKQISNIDAYSSSILVLTLCGLISIVAAFVGRTEFFSTVLFGLAAALIVSFVVDRGTRDIATHVQHFAPDTFCREIRHAEHHVWIVETWMRQFLHTGEQINKFENAVKFACGQNHVDIKIILAMPECEAVRKKAEILTDGCNGEYEGQSAKKIIEEMHIHLAILQSLKDSIDAAARLRPAEAPKFEVRIDNDSPHFAIYRVDDKIYWNFYRDTTLLLNEPFHVTKVRKGDSFAEYFFSLYCKSKWDDQRTMTLDAYYHLVDRSFHGDATGGAYI
jgi:hypothetical protein